MADDPTEPSESPDQEAPDQEAADQEAPDQGAADQEAPDQGAADQQAAASGPVADIAVTGPTAAGDGTAAPVDATVVRKKVTSKRVSPKGSAQGVKASSSSPSSKAKAPGDHDFSYSKRYTPPKATYAPGPSPWWVPALMFGLLIVGALVIMLNYMGVFGPADNLRLVIGLVFILGGIITATQYR